MKKTAVLLVFFAVTAGMVRAQDSFSLGGGVEANLYSNYKLLGLGPAIALDYRFNEMWQVGARGIWAIDLGDTAVAPEKFGSTWDVAFDVRWYFLRWRDFVNYHFLWSNRWHFFVQLDVGMAIYSKQLDEEMGDGFLKPAPSGMAFNVGGEVGVRIMFDSIYLEPYIRYSWRSSIAAGILVGYTFHSNRGGF
ncbi:hypothetical protein FACS189494_01360 [Spirochaetia bacterium]|nr:hypothetical protein FACS189494_01360 [Spirochaetia bacterium]